MLTHLLSIHEKSTGLVTSAWRVIGVSRAEAEAVSAALKRIPGVISFVLDTADLPPVNANTLFVNIAYQGDAEDGSQDVNVEFNALAWLDDPTGQKEWAETLDRLPAGKVAGFCKDLGPAEEWAAANGVL